MRDKAVMERTAVLNKEEEERYIQEEKDKMSAEMYEQWLVSRVCHLYPFIYAISLE